MKKNTTNLIFCATAAAVVALQCSVAWIVAALVRLVVLLVGGVL